MTTTLTTRNIMSIQGRLLLAAALMVLALAAFAPRADAAPGAAISVSPGSAQPNQAITVSGTGFDPGELVDVYFGGSLIGSTAASPTGSFSVRGQVPDMMPPGGHPLDAVGSMGSSATVSYQVDAAPASPPSTAPPSGGGSSSGGSTSGSGSAAPAASTVGSGETDPDATGELDDVATDEASAAGQPGAGAFNGLVIWVIVALVVAGGGVVLLAIWEERREHEQHQEV